MTHRFTTSFIAIVALVAMVVGGIAPALHQVSAAAAPFSLTVGKSVTGGNVLAISVAIGTKAPTGGTTVKLASSNKVLPVPSKIVVPAGQRSAKINVTAKAVAADTLVTITGNYSGVSVPKTTTVLAPTLTAVVVSKSIAVGKTGTLVITLSGVAPTGGLAVRVTSSNTSVISVPSKVVVPSGKNTTTVTLAPVNAKVSTKVTMSTVMGKVTMTRVTVVGQAIPTSTAAPTKTATAIVTKTATKTATPIRSVTATLTRVPTKTATPIRTPSPTRTTLPPTATKTFTVAPTSTFTATPVPPTNTFTATPVPPTATNTFTATPIPPTATNTFTATPVPPTATSTWTATAVPPTATKTWTPTTVPPTNTATAVPPTMTFTATAVPPTMTFTATAVPPTATKTSTPTTVPPTNTATAVPPTATFTATAVPPTATPATGYVTVTRTSGTATISVGNTVTFQVCYVGTASNYMTIALSTSNNGVSWELNPWSYNIPNGSTGAALCQSVTAKGNAVGTFRLTVTAGSGASFPTVTSELITVK